MTNATRPFARYIYKNNNQFLLNLPFGRQMKLGDIFTVRGGKVSKSYYGNVSEVGVKLAPESDDTLDNESWSGTHGTSIESEFVGSTPSTGSVPPISARLKVQFERKGSFLFQSRDVHYDRIRNVIEVENDCREKLSKKMLGLAVTPWLITEVVVAQSYALAIAQSDRSTWEVGGNVDFALGIADLANVGLNLKVVRESRMEISKLGAGPTTLFFKARKLKLKLRALSEETALNARSLPEDTLSLESIANKAGRDLLQWENVSFDDLGLEDGE